MDTFNTKINDIDLEAIVTVCARFDIDPLSSDEAEDYFVTVLATARAAGETLPKAVERVLAEEFRCLDASPRWIQGTAWQFTGDQPMVFVGQIDHQRTPAYLHDDTSFYVFWSPHSGETRTVIQTA